jgi:hypothetical protein
MSSAWRDRLRISREGRLARLSLKKDREKRMAEHPQKQPGGGSKDKGKGKERESLPTDPPLPPNFADRHPSDDWTNVCDHDPLYLFEHDHSAERILEIPGIKTVVDLAQTDVDAGLLPPRRLLPIVDAAQCLKKNFYMSHQPNANNPSRYGDRGPCSNGTRTVLEAVEQEEGLGGAALVRSSPALSVSPLTDHLRPRRTPPTTASEECWSTRTALPQVRKRRARSRQTRVKLEACCWS